MTTPIATIAVLILAGYAMLASVFIHIIARDLDRLNSTLRDLAETLQKL